MFLADSSSTLSSASYILKAGRCISLHTQSVVIFHPIYAAWSTLFERGDLSTSTQVEYDTLNIPIPKTTIITSFFNILHTIFINTKKPDYHNNPFVSFILSINDPANYQHLFQANSSYCIISETISHLINNFECPYIQDPDIMCHNYLQYALHQLRLSPTLDSVIARKRAHSHFPIINITQSAHIYNPTHYHAFSARSIAARTPIFNFASQLPEWTLTIHNNYHSVNRKLFKLLPHDINPTTTPFPLNNRNFSAESFAPSTLTGIIRNVMYNKYIFENRLTTNNQARVPLARSLIEQCINNYCGIDKTITTLTIRGRLNGM